VELGSKGTVYIAIGLAALGFFAIFLGWNGAAEKDYVEGQIPYVISGAAAGLGLIAAGLAVAVTEARRRDTAKLTGKIDRLLEHLGATDEVLEQPSVADRMSGARRSRRSA
jgi:hypothetical protein